MHRSTEIKANKKMIKMKQLTHFDGSISISRMLAVQHDSCFYTDVLHFQIHFLRPT